MMMCRSHHFHCSSIISFGVQRREMGKYRLPPAHARHTGGMTTNYLEAVEAESDYEDDGLTASDRARRSLHRDRYDEEAEVLLQCLPYFVQAFSPVACQSWAHWLWDRLKVNAL